MSDDEKPSDRACIGTHAVAPGGQIEPSGSMPAAAASDDERLDALLPLGNSPLAPRGRGRPVGSKNRRTDLVAEYLVERFGDPLTASMATAGMPLKDLVQQMRVIASEVGMKLGASVMDIARFQRDCRNDALPYIHAKRAPETAKGDPVLPIIGIGRADQVIVAGGRSLEDAVVNSQRIQSVTVIDANVSHDDKSQDGESDDVSDT